MPSRILFVFGTRPEAIKLAPVIEELSHEPASFDVRVCVTGQHREMLTQVLDLFRIRPDLDLQLMRPDQHPADVAASVMAGVRRIVDDLKPAVVIVQGDTTSAMAAALAAFYAGIDVAHVEAGLRSGDLEAPWPEEANRRLITVVAKMHFAPTEHARSCLEREGATGVVVTGNTVVDALLQVRGDGSSFSFLDDARRLVLVTAHRRESFGAPLESICHAVAELARAHPDVEIVYPVHPNPNVRTMVHAILGGQDRVHLIEPVDYQQFVWLMRRSTLILSDSGGVQEEAPALGKAVLLLRDTTERPEAVEAGNVRIVGTDRARIVAEAGALLRDPERLAEMAQVRYPFGDGHASKRIRDALFSRYVRA